MTVKVKVAQLCPTLFDPRTTHSPWNFPGQNTGVGSLVPSLSDLPNPGIEPRSPMLPADSLPAEPPGKPKNTWVGSLSLQWIFRTQELNWVLLRWRWILYQLSYKGSPNMTNEVQSQWVEGRREFWLCVSWGGLSIVWQEKLPEKESCAILQYS